MDWGFGTLEKTKEARGKKQDWRLVITFRLAIVGIVTNETGESNEPMMRILSVVCIAKLLLYCLAFCTYKRQQ
ncbi:hypothetical protein [Arcicella rosea]|uniref:Putative membrane protein n=1 Tax=Arcicella rosea TaxID=502909 RepID=A0A841EV03_9BACT|nr:hypothetical protein [Arcicella rosea]MBB6005219.1 putative membrane protein [Arcicella rosea]